MTSRQATSAYALKAGKAVRAVGQAVKRGELLKTPCEECGSTERVQGHHHNGYEPEHALDVVWLCHKHHMRRHRRSQKPSWKRGTRAYMRLTGRSELTWGGKVYSFAEFSGPPHLFKTIERVWGLLRTDEEREWAKALVERLSSR